MRIETASGHVILADDADAVLLSQYSWYTVKSKGRLYAHARVPRTFMRVAMHRLLMAPPTDKVVHHINNDGLDNRRTNLEVTTTRQNIRYRFAGKVTGIHPYKQTGRWRAQLRGPDGKRVSLGIYATRDDAVRATETFKANAEWKR